MRPLPTFLPILFLCLTPVFTSIGEDAQVIRSGKSILTIYTYGIGEARRVAPEMPEHQPRTAALSDVVTSPPLSTSLRFQPRAPAADSHFGTAAETTATAARTAPVPKTANTTFGTSSGQSSLTMASDIPAFVAIGWQPSPDQSVVGYNIYTGPVSRHYNNRQTLGNQTFAQLPAGQGVLYVAVTAYTAEGIESLLSKELVVSTMTSDGATTMSSGAGGGFGSH